MKLLRLHEFPDQPATSCARTRSCASGVQQGLTSQGYEPGPLSDTEMCMRQFHDLLRQQIPEMALDRVPTTFA